MINLKDPSSTAQTLLTKIIPGIYRHSGLMTDRTIVPVPRWFKRGADQVNSQMRIAFIGVVTAVFLTESTFGQSITSRYSKLNFNYVYGAGGDSHTGGNIIEDNVLLATDTETAGFSDGTSGVLPNNESYSAAVSCDLNQSYLITGPLTAFESISASGDVDVASAAAGAGVALMFSTNPGNELLFHFNVATSVHYDLGGNFTHPDPGVFHGVLLQRFNGFTWESVFSTFFLPNGPFASSGFIQPGQYRLWSFIGVNVQGSQTLSTSYDYTLAMRRSADMNCDGLVDGRDIGPFVTALLDAPAYESQFAECERLNGDVNFDDAVTAADIALFAQCVLNGGCQ